MAEPFIEDVYQSLLGNMVTPLKGVENAFAYGKLCDKKYRDAMNAYARLRDRLGVLDEDEDVETIISSLLSVQKELCIEMFSYGAKFSTK